MYHYIDIHLRTDPEFPPHQLMAALFTKLHRSLAVIGNQQIAVAFPGYREKPATLGQSMRLIGPASEISKLMERSWLQGMSDHVDVTPQAAVPSGVPQRSLCRVQAKSSPARLRRRQMRRHQLTPEQAMNQVPDHCAETLDLPFVTIASASTGQRFKLFLRLSPPVSTARQGEFNSYGLSGSATIPWF